MAFVVRRSGGRWEIRESVATKAGPRSRTLATFKILSPKVIDRAVDAARGSVDRADLVRSAKRAGVPFELPRGDALARDLLRSVAQGEYISPGLRRMVADRLGGATDHAIDDSLAGYLGASLEERGRALVDLLDLGDSLPHAQSGPLRFPPFSRLSRGA